MNYCVDCEYVKKTSDVEVKALLSELTKSQRRNAQIPEHMCNHPDNLDPITKEPMDCEDVRAEHGACGLLGSNFKMRIKP